MGSNYAKTLAAYNPRISIKKCVPIATTTSTSNRKYSIDKQNTKASNRICWSSRSCLFLIRRRSWVSMYSLLRVLRRSCCIRIICSLDTLTLVNKYMINNNIQILINNNRKIVVNNYYKILNNNNKITFNNSYKMMNKK